MLIILDRDGVINEESDNFIRSPEEWHALPGSLAAIARLKQAGHIVVVATNQSGIGRGYYTLATLTAIHEKMQNEIQKAGGGLDGIFFCPHIPEDQCDCRKPKPGLLKQIQHRFPEHFANAIFIGDTLRDVQAAEAIGCRAIFVKTGYGKKHLAEIEARKSVSIYENLAIAVDAILAECLKEPEIHIK